MRWRSRLLTWSMTLLIAAIPARVAAQRIPLKSYSTGNGLSNNYITRIVADSRGFLWFCTLEGLSRFDGDGFSNYGIDDGLPGPRVNDLLETSDGTYWVATARGLARFDPLGSSRQKFSVILPSSLASSHDVRALFEDRAGVVWIGTLGGLFSVSPDGARAIAHPLPVVSEVMAITQDVTGALWAGTSHGLYRMTKDQLEYLNSRDGLPGDFVSSLITDRHGRIWIGTREGGIATMDVDPENGRTSLVSRFGVRAGLPSTWVYQIIQRADGSIWAATFGGLAEFQPAGRGYRIRTIDSSHGLPADPVSAIVEDRHRSLWSGGELGAARLGRLEFAVFGQADGIKAPATLFETQSGDLLVQEGSARGTRIARFDGTRFVTAEIPPSRAPGGWSGNQTFLIDRQGDWWVGARTGVLRYRGIKGIDELPRAAPVAIYNRSTGLPADVVLRLFEDSRGDIWVSTTGEGKGNGLSRWRRSTSTWEHWDRHSDALPLLSFHASSLAEDREGQIWVGFSGIAGLARFRNGTWARFDAAHGVPSGPIYDLLVDSRGWLWVPTSGGGLAVAAEPAADPPVFVTYTTAQGLSSNLVWTAVESAGGEILAGTGRGLDRLDPATRRVTTAAAEGFPLGRMHAALRSRTGAIWFSFISGLVRYTPAEVLTTPLPSMLITGVDVSGDRRAISALGQPDLPAFDLAAGLTLQVEFVAPVADPVRRQRYQIKLEGGDVEWSAPSANRRVTFANLSPGSYRFAVRAVDAEGAISPEAGFRFTVLAPIWRRWWFLTCVVIVVTGGAHVVYRRRMARLLEIAGMRARIATDLHDDIGANLTRIAVLSEVARQQRDAAGNGGTLDRQLESIAGVARESMTAMSDIVWAISPEHDSVDELVHKMREYAGEVLGDTALTFEPPDGRHVGRLGADVRREVYLIFKEAINNVARHAHATAVAIQLRIDGHGLVLGITDNGAGFTTDAADDGNGLVSMRRRAERLGGQLTVASSPGRGATVRLTVQGDPARKVSPSRQPGT